MLCTIISPSIHCTACICTTPQHPPINRHHQSSCFHQLSSSIHVSTIFDYLPSVDYKLNPDRLYATYFGGDAAQGLEVDVEGDGRWWWHWWWWWSSPSLWPCPTYSSSSLVIIIIIVLIIIILIIIITHHRHHHHHIHQRGIFGWGSFPPTELLLVAAKRTSGT